MGSGLNDFLAETGVIGETPPSYTVEISWSGKASRPLTGWVNVFAYTFKIFGDFDPAIPLEEQVDDADLVAEGYKMLNFDR
ncbi:hypothetical protein ES703_105969 [subsurface metagenome]